MDPDKDRRWPRSVYGVGAEPDPRFSFANERTTLAWLRTALALIAAGVSVEVFLDPLTGVVRKAIAVVLLVLGVACSVGAFVRWARNLSDTKNKAEFYPDVHKRDLFRLGYIAAQSGHSRGSTIDMTLVQRDGREVADGEIKPACAQACPAQALVFGDLEDPESAVSRLSRSSRGSKLLEDIGTGPAVTYLSRQS